MEGYERDHDYAVKDEESEGLTAVIDIAHQLNAFVTMNGTYQTPCDCCPYRRAPCGPS
jgi:hypothetical protein